MKSPKQFYLDLLKRQFGIEPTTAFFVEGDDLKERGWGSDGCAFQIVWEDGPFDWAVEIFNNAPGYYAEAYNGFVLCVYDESAEYGPLNEPEPKTPDLNAAIAKAQAAWDAAIAKEPDAGTCTGGKGLYLKDSWNLRSMCPVIVRAYCQGNVPAQRTKDIPMKIMEDAGFPCDYYDGWMD
jgi:hypothetical protein